MATSIQPGRIVLWGVPMCLSTVFTRSISARGDAEIFMEPFDNCHCFGPERRISWPEQMRSSDLLNDWQTYVYTKALLEENYPGTKIVFVKDMAFAIDGKYEMLPAGYRHTFIIRNPVKVWLAYHKRITQLLSRAGAGSAINGNNNVPHPLTNLERYASPSPVFKASFDLMEYVRTTLHQEPVIIDADDLADRPEATMRLYCSAVNIPYKDSMLTLGSPTDDKVGVGQSQKWHCSKFFTWGGENGGFYAKAMRSKEFVSDKKEYKMSSLPPEVRECVLRSQQWYDKMYALRLKLE